MGRGASRASGMSSMTYSVKEIFYSLQGEGAHAGRPAIFCRFSGCNLWSGREQDRSTAVCKFCDTDFVGTDGIGGGQFTTAEALARKIKSYWPESITVQARPYVICTGGEPLLQLDEALIKALHVEGIGLSKASQMVGLLEPLAGPMAASIFAFGLIAAGVSSQIPNVLMLPWLLCDYTGAERNMTLGRYRTLVFVSSLLGLVVPIFDARPVVVMIVSQAFNAVILPVTVACIFYLSNRKDLMQGYKNGWIANSILGAIFLFSLFTSSVGIRGLWQMV